MIAIFQAATAFGAVERYLLAVVEGLRGRDEDVVLFCPAVPALEPLVRAGGGNVQVVSYSPSLLGRAPLLVGWLAWRFRRLRPRVVHVNDPWPAALVAARLARVPRVLVTHHTPELPRHDSAAGRLWRWLGWRTRPEIVYTSEADRAGDVPRGPSRVVYYGIDLERFASAEPALAADGPVVGNVARLAPQKGHRFLIEAAPHVLARHPETLFVLVGDGELREDLEQRARTAGVAERFLFTGERDDIPELLASFDVFALPSLYEGLCYAVIEAQAAGVPVVATPVGGVRENVVPGETGILCSPGDAESLADGILHALEHRAEALRMAERARRRVFERYSVRRMVEETIALYA